MNHHIEQLVSVLNSQPNDPTAPSPCHMEETLQHAGDFETFCWALRLYITDSANRLEPLLEGYGDLLEQVNTLTSAATITRLARKIAKRWLSKHPDEQVFSKLAEAQSKSSGAHSNESQQRDIRKNRRTSPATPRSYQAFSTAFDRIAPYPLAVQWSDSLYTEDRVIVSMRRKLARTLWAIERNRWIEHLDRGQLSSKSVYRLGIAQDSVHVFRRRGFARGRSVCVSLCLDLSASMVGQKLRLAKQSVMAIIQALDRLRIPTEVLGFTTGHEFTVKDAVAVSGKSQLELKRLYCRFANLNIGLIKQFKEPARRSIRRLANVKAGGMTPLGEAVAIAVKRIFHRSEARKVLLVLTDGHAGCECHSNVAVDHARDVANHARQLGIELVGIGSMDESICGVIGSSVVVTDLDQLPETLCSTLVQSVTKGVWQ